MMKMLLRLFSNREMRKNMAALQQLGTAERKLAANDLALTTQLIRNSHPRHLQFFIRDAANSRHVAIANGANGRNFGDWLVPAINETLLTYASIDGRGSREFAQAIAQVDEFVRCYTTQIERTTAVAKADRILADLDRIP